MDDEHAFERQLAAEIGAQAGPPHAVDAVTITRTAMAEAPPWTFRSMFSPARAVTVGALALAIGGVMLVAQPFRQASVTAPGADAEATALVLDDGTGDFWAQPHYVEEGEWVETRGPAEADLVAVTVFVEGERLVVRFETAGAVPQVPAVDDGTFYMLLIDTNGDAEAEYESHTWFGDHEWLSELDDRAAGEAVEQAEAEMAVVDGTVTASFRLDALPVAPSEMRFAALTEVYQAFDDTYNVFNWIPRDRAPDFKDSWRVLGEADS